MWFFLMRLIDTKNIPSLILKRRFKGFIIGMRQTDFPGSSRTMRKIASPSCVGLAMTASFGRIASPSCVGLAMTCRFAGSVMVCKPNCLIFTVIARRTRRTAGTTEQPLTTLW